MSIYDEVIDHLEGEVVVPASLVNRLKAANPIAILDAHTPSVTREIEEQAFLDQDPAFDDGGDYCGDTRQCGCGVILHGYYEYVDHLKKVLS